ncbi:hypothetical protein L21_1638 [Methanoculleus chikugoensis]|jgi:hypothetical protein|uniref:Uncharacterized protein n=1 Tax=Methanoculleus chikugoensis TaxID=118126 RepID=A0A1M4MLL5_9EURY|nr:transglutaminase domain-containing protein [Methanoculleus chikugoensis]MDD4566407.1 transglutaminase domain-containing protein [Methanoculleus chikugoensis]SCL75727.1 hypothetical protein L21_1638 [Methanoculleus chikugoensis]
MTGDPYHPRRFPTKAVIVILVVIGIAAIWGGQIASSVGTAVTGTLEASGLSSPEVSDETLETGPKTINLAYVLRGKPGSIRFDAYRGVNDYLSTKYPASFRDDRDYWLQFVDESIQDRYLKQLAENIRAAEPEPDNQVRAAISMVQQIPYADYSFDTAAKYPYHVLYHKDGDCDEKSLLLAYLLREMGYGVALFEFEQESHMALGIKAPDRYCYRDTGYAFIETTVPSIPTDAGGEYGDDGITMTSKPKVFVIAEGDSFEGIWREHADAVEWNKIRGMGPKLDSYTYGRYRNLAQTYGMDYGG